MGGIYIDAGQMVHLEAAQRDILVCDILELLGDAWPMEVRQWQGEALHQFVSAAVRIAALDGFSVGRDLAHYANIVFAVKTDIDPGADPHALSWIHTNRADRSQNPQTRLARIYLQLYRRYEQASGASG